jgi:hypothetical protein
VIAQHRARGGSKTHSAGLLFGTTPALRATPPDSGGEPQDSILEFNHTVQRHAAASGQLPCIAFVGKYE